MIRYFLLLLAFCVILTVNANATCRQVVDFCGFYGNVGECVLDGHPNPGTRPNCSACEGDIKQSCINGGSYAEMLSFSICSGLNPNSGIGCSGASCSPFMVCDSQCELDSAMCVYKGNNWISSTVAGECGTCQQCTDTTWTEISCAYVPERGQYLNVKNIYEIRDCQPYSKSSQYYSATCDSAGSDTTITCIGSIDGINVMLRGAGGKITTCNADGSCSFAIQKVINGECENPNPDPRSSSSNNQSSSSYSSSSYSSSSYSSSSNDNQSSSDNGSSGNDSPDDLPERLYDSLGAIHAAIDWYQPLISNTNTAVWEIAGTAHDINTNQIGIRENTNNISSHVESIDNKLSTSNRLLQDIKDKNWAPTIVVEAPEVNIVDSTKLDTKPITDSVHNTNNLLGQIINAIGNIKSDTIQLDTSKAPHNIDSTLQYWGDRNNHNYGAAGLDTSNWSHTNDSASAAADSAIAGSIWTSAMGCDTTGGHKCDNSVIGVGGLDSATNALKGSYKSLGDTLKNGAFGDSLRNWSNKFTSNGVLSGSGSNTCPSVLTRNYRVNIYRGAGFDFTLGRYVCQPLFGNTNAWTLCRLLLRASIALACMWFLFKCATGFKGSGGDED